MCLLDLLIENVKEKQKVGKAFGGVYDIFRGFF